MDETQSLRMTVNAALFAALIAVGAYVSLPVGPVPIVLQNLFAYLAGLLLGGRWGTAAVALYLLAGASGLPVFAGGTGGIGRFIGPTGGYLVGYLPAVWFIGRMSEKHGGRLPVDVLAMVCGTLILYAFGVMWLKVLTGMTWSRTVAVGMLPFLPGDALKIAVAAVLARALRPYLQKSSYPSASAGIGVDKRPPPGQ